MPRSDVRRFLRAAGAARAARAAALRRRDVGDELSDIELLRRRLEVASSVAQCKSVHDLAAAQAIAAAKAKRFDLADDFIAVRVQASAKGGAMLLAGEPRATGIDDRLWESRGQMTPRDIEIATRRIQAILRKAHGDDTPRPPMPKEPRSGVAGNGGPMPSACVHVTEFYFDPDGFPTRFVIGVDRREMKAAGAAGLADIERRLVIENLGVTQPVRCPALAQPKPQARSRATGAGTTAPA